MKPKLEIANYIFLDGTLDEVIKELEHQWQSAIKHGYDETTLMFKDRNCGIELWGSKVETEEERIAREAKEEQARHKKLQKLKKDAEQLGYKLVEKQE